MKRMAAVLAALGISTAAVASDLTQMEEQSYDRIASGEALPSGESAYGYSMSDPYTEHDEHASAYEDEYYVVEEILVPSDSVVLIPLEDEEG